MPSPQFSVDLSGQTALVTGASSGLGLRFARVLAAQGANVALAGRRIDRLDAEAQAICAQGGRAAGFQLDVTNTDALATIVDRVAEVFDAPTILINNAGIPDASRAHKVPVELLDKVLGTNVRAPFILSCAVARKLMAANLPGRIVNISSMAAYHYRGDEGAALYSISKAAIARMTETLAMEWAKFNINVNGIAPGLFSSEMAEGMLARMGDLSAHFPRKRVGQPSQLDSTLLYLVSPSSECVTGTIVKVDDGQVGR